MKKVLLAAALVASCGVASAQNYAGAVLGLSGLNATCDGASCDNTDTGYKLYGGYGVAPNLAIEVAYTDFGKATASGVGVLYNNIKTSSVSVVGAFRMALGTDFTGVARLGLASTKTKWDLTNAGSKSKIGLYAGLGAEYALTKDIMLTGLADLATGEVNGDSATVYLVGVGAQVGF